MVKIRSGIALAFFIMMLSNANSQQLRISSADIGLDVGVLQKGALNAITDVKGVMVGHKTLISGEDIRTGVTAIMPHSGNIFQEKLPAAIYCFNGFGKLAGYLQVKELGNLETPIILTNTLSVGTAVEASVEWVLGLEGNEQLRSVNAVVGETNDGFLNNIRRMAVKRQDVLDAIQNASAGVVEEGSVGAGTGTVAFGYKGGIGTSSRLSPPINQQQYTIGVLVQTNFGRELLINGIPYTREIRSGSYNPDGDGSCMIVIATDAPIDSRNLERLARHAFNGMARTTPFMSNGSGDFAIAFSTAYRIPHGGPTYPMPELIGNNAMNALFQAVEEAVQEAIYNSLLMATEITGHQGNQVKSVSHQIIQELLIRYNMHRINERLQ